MRLILILIAVLVVGLLVNRQLGKGSDLAESQLTEEGTLQPPKVPTRVEEVPQFETDMNQFMQDAESQRAQQLEQAGQ